jgi:hypothetical protein
MALFFCGVVLSHYNSYNLSKKSQVQVYVYMYIYVTKQPHDPSTQIIQSKHSPPAPN